MLINMILFLMWGGREDLCWYNQVKITSYWKSGHWHMGRRTSEDRQSLTMLARPWEAKKDPALELKETPQPCQTPGFQASSFHNSEKIICKPPGFWQFVQEVLGKQYIALELQTVGIEPHSPDNTTTYYTNRAKTWNKLDCLVWISHEIGKSVLNKARGKKTRKIMALL